MLADLVAQSMKPRPDGAASCRATVIRQALSLRRWACGALLLLFRARSNGLRIFRDADTEHGMSNNLLPFLIIAAGLVAIAYFANSLVGAFR